MDAFRAIVSGRVQMVMFRDFAQRNARSLGVSGTVKNLQDGTVEIIAEGDKNILDAYIEKLKKGSMLSRVDNVAVEWRTSTTKYDGFQILF